MCTCVCVCVCVYVNERERESSFFPNNFFKVGGSGAAVRGGPNCSRWSFERVSHQRCCALHSIVVVAVVVVVVARASGTKKFKSCC